MTTALLRRLGLIADAATAQPTAPKPLVTYTEPAAPVYASAAEERYHTFGITR